MQSLALGANSPVVPLIEILPNFSTARRYLARMPLKIQYTPIQASRVALSTGLSSCPETLTQSPTEIPTLFGPITPSKDIFLPVNSAMAL